MSTHARSAVPRLILCWGWFWITTVLAVGGDHAALEVTLEPAQGAVDLPRILDHLLEDAPTVRGARLEREARTRKRAQVTDLPDPMLEFRDWIRQMEPADDLDGRPHPADSLAREAAPRRTRPRCRGAPGGLAIPAGDQRGHLRSEAELS